MLDLGRPVRYFREMQDQLMVNWWFGFLVVLDSWDPFMKGIVT